MDAAKIERIAGSFCGNDPGRSVCVFADHLAYAPIGTNTDVPRPAASVIKIAVVMALFDLAAAGRIDLSENVSATALGQTRYCSILKAFDVGRTLSLRELAGLSLMTSDNPAMVFLMSRVGFADTARVLREAGCSEHATFVAGFRETELGPANRANRLTAQDAVYLFRHLARQARYAPIITFLENNLRNSRIPALLTEHAVVAHKTGSLDGVVNDAGIVSQDDKSFTVAFLSEAQEDPVMTQYHIAICSLELFHALIAT